MLSKIQKSTIPREKKHFPRPPRHALPFFESPLRFDGGTIIRYLFTVRLCCTSPFVALLASLYVWLPAHLKQELLLLVTGFRSSAPIVKRRRRWTPPAHAEDQEIVLFLPTLLKARPSVNLETGPVTATESPHSRPWCRCLAFAAAELLTMEPRWGRQRDWGTFV